MNATPPMPALVHSGSTSTASSSKSDGILPSPDLSAVNRSLSQLGIKQAENGLIDDGGAKSGPDKAAVNSNKSLLNVVRCQLECFIPSRISC